MGVGVGVGVGVAPNDAFQDVVIEPLHRQPAPPIQLSLSVPLAVPAVGLKVPETLKLGQ